MKNVIQIHLGLPEGQAPTDEQLSEAFSTVHPKELIAYTQDHHECLPLLKQRLFDLARSNKNAYLGRFHRAFPEERINQIENWLVDIFGVEYIQKYVKNPCYAISLGELDSPKGVLYYYTGHKYDFADWYSIQQKESERKVEI